MGMVVLTLGNCLYGKIFDCFGLNQMNVQKTVGILNPSFELFTTGITFLGEGNSFLSSHKLDL